MADGQDYFLILLVLSVLLNFILPVPPFLSPPFTYSGFLIIGFGCFLALWSRSLFLKKSTTLQLSEEPSLLVTSGPFRLSRNPVFQQRCVCH
jgi:protein-S-isoprenylcysteine O-methyltransferase Ste14